MKKMKIILLSFLLLMSLQGVDAQRMTEDIRLNQLGFYPNSPKIAVVPETDTEQFFLLTPDFTDTLFTGKLDPVQDAPNSGERVRVADFSEIKRQGTYVVWVEGTGYSWPFAISNRVYEDAAKASLKGFYHQRMSMPIEVKYGGKWARPAGHPDTSVVVHPSAATEQWPAGSKLSAPGGWYDAGDYNKYSVNSGITMATLFSLYENFPEYVKSLDTNIPESGNGLPDLLNEGLWNLRWYLKMQDPYDGGVYHKLTTAEFSGQIMPAEGNETRYVVQKSVTGTLNFAAVMAQASRIFNEHEEAVPGLADSTLEAAKKAWEWARENPDQLYRQNEMNERYDPDIETGAYGDSNPSDEFSWAAIELYATTGNRNYFDTVNLFTPEEASLPSWGNVQTLGYYTLARMEGDKDEDEIEKAKKLIVDLADRLTEGVSETGYRTVMDSDAGNYIWGSSSVAANQGIALIQAWLITNDQTYLNYALSNLDYLLGRNATGYSFLTGYGFKTPMNIHHRPSEANPIPDPVPGLLAGGPNAGQQDGCEYSSDLPALSYIDDWCSYASNEIAINWNAPMVYLTGALEALQYRAQLAE